MALEMGMRLIKYLLFAFNFIFVVIGAVLIGLGVTTKAGWNEKYFAFVKTSDFSTPPNILIGVGVLIFIIAFLGCCGAIKENHCMIMTYSVLVGLILVLQIGAAVAAFALKDDAANLITEGLEKTQQQYGINNETGIEATNAWDVLQSTLHCCGTKNFNDWNLIIPRNSGSLPLIPESCCKEDHTGCSKGIVPEVTPVAVAEKTIYVEGCMDKAIAEFAVGTLGTISIVLAVIELLGVICACFLARSVRYSYETV